MRRYGFAALLISAVLAPALYASTVTPLHEGWLIQSGCKISAAGGEISTAKFSPKDWIKATVPTTVLAAQVAAGLLPDPYFGDNLRKIPGTSYPIGANYSNLPMSPDSPYHCGWWYRNTFAAPAAHGNNRFWLHFGGINYRANIWLNGHQIANSSQIAGMFRIYDLDVTSEIKPGKPNVLAVEVIAPTEKDLSISWIDWNPAPPDKNMGLWGNVDLVSTGPVALRSPMVATHFPDDNLDVADLTVEAELENATDHQVSATVSGTAAGAQFEQTVELAPRAQQMVKFTPDKYPQLKIHNPKIWWPQQMGTPNLETLAMSIAVNGQKSDAQSTDFGIREITSELTARSTGIDDFVGNALNSRGSLLFRVNGKKILIRGGGWAPDMMLRHDPARLDKQFQLVRDLGLNTLRLEGKMEPREFFDLADKNGILVMVGWSCCDMWQFQTKWVPENLPIATASLRSQLLRLRHHPSVLVWLNGSDTPPIAQVENAYLQVEAELNWPNPVLSSASAAPTTVTGPSGVKMTGPYDYVEPSYWYVDHSHGGNFGFNTETSPGPAIPSLASRKLFLSDPEAWPPSADWSLHYGGGGFKTLSVADNAMQAMYAKPTSIADYTRMASTMEYDSERAMFESYSSNKYVSTGVIQWMLNNAWPSMIWHLYDYNLDPGAGFYAVKKACEPLHIQYAYDNQAVVVVNSTYHAAQGLRASVDLRDLQWNELYSDTKTVNAAADSSQLVFALPASVFNGMTRTFLIDLKLTNASGQVVSRNFYWVPYTLTQFNWAATKYTHTPAERYPDLSALAHLPTATVTARAEGGTVAKGRNIQVHLKNTSGTLAFQLRLEALTSSGGLIAPVVWSDNWIELAPGESRTLTTVLPANAPADTVVKLSGWNIAPQTLTPGSGSSATKQD